MSGGFLLLLSTPLLPNKNAAIRNETNMKGRKRKRNKGHEKSVTATAVIKMMREKNTNAGRMKARAIGTGTERGERGERRKEIGNGSEKGTKSMIERRQERNMLNSQKTRARGTMPEGRNDTGMKGRKRSTWKWSGREPQKETERKNGRGKGGDRKEKRRGSGRDKNGKKGKERMNQDSRPMSSGTGRTRKKENEKKNESRHVASANIGGK